MKECYFTLENVHRRAEQFWREVTTPGTPLKFTFCFPSAALLVLDMQNYFLQPDSHAFIPSAPAIIPAAQALMEAFHRYRRPVLFTRHLNTPQNAGLMASWWCDLIERENPLSEITCELNTSLGTVLEKTRYDAFYKTSLETWLLEQKISQVVMVGVMTHLCYETTARSAFVRGFQVFLPVDGTATYNEQFHLNSLKALAHGFAIPVMTEKVLMEINNA